MKYSLVFVAALLAATVIPTSQAQPHETPAAVVVKSAPQANPSINLNGASPSAGAKDIPPDAPFRLFFSTPPTLGPTGQIKISDTTTGAVVETIDVAQRTATQTIGGTEQFKYYPVIITDNEATIYPRHGSLTYGHSYQITIDDGVFLDGTAPYPGLGLNSAWHFATRAAAPASGCKRLIVASDGSGDFCTVQGALDFIPAGNSAPVTVFVRRGTYTEIVAFEHKDHVTILGEDRKQTVIAYANNDVFNPSAGNPYDNGNSPDHEPRALYHRGVLLAHRAAYFTLANLTIRNTTQPEGPRAECIIVNGTDGARTILRDVDLYSAVDTLQINGQAYINGCYIEGDVDFMWGTGPSFFENCTARSIRSKTYYTQIRNPKTKHGFVYYHCVFEGAPGVSDNYLSRVEPNRFPYSEVVLLDCTLSSAVGSVAWLFQGKNPPKEPTVHFWEYKSHTPDGIPVDVTHRFASSRQLREKEEAEIISNYSSPSFVLGQGWNPRAGQ